MRYIIAATSVMVFAVPYVLETTNIFAELAEIFRGIMP